ncbi:MAG: hypothetical protein JXR83_09975 [Deltaproteobacteria bacterium]|nr:hypothetical protein [Deltaproteobacteria bacterium]
MCSNRWHRALACVLLLAFLGCAYDNAIKRGDELYQARNYRGALAQYEEALRLKPDSQEARDKVRRARNDLLSEHVASARTLLAGGDVLRAIDAAGAAYQLVPDAELALTVVREVAAKTQEHAAGLLAESNYASAVNALDLAYAKLPPAQAEVAPKRNEARTTWARALGDRGQQAEKAGRKGEALLMFGKAALLVDNQEYTARRAALHGELSAQTVYVVRLVGSDPGAAAIAASLRGKVLKSGLAIVGASDAAPRADARVKLSVSRPAFDTQLRRRNETARYQSGTQQVANPFYQTRLDAVADEQRRLTEYENEVTKLENAVTRYQADVAREGDTPNVTTGAEQNLYNAQNNLESARRRVIDQRNQLQRARDELAREPQFKEEPAYSSLVYTVTTHTLRASAALRGTIEHADRRPELPLAADLVVEAQDDEHPPQRTAHLAGDPLQLPSQTDLANQLYGQGSERLAAAILESHDGFRQALLRRGQTAPSDGERIDAYVIYYLADPGAVDPATVNALAQLSGIPDAPAALAAP